MDTSDTKTGSAQAAEAAARSTTTSEVQRDANGMPIAVPGDSHSLLERTRLVLCISLLTFFFLNPFALLFDTLRGVGLGLGAGSSSVEASFERAGFGAARGDYARAHDGSRLLLAHDDLPAGKSQYSNSIAQYSRDLYECTVLYGADNW